jgi:hypothetical protein
MIDNKPQEAFAIKKANEKIKNSSKSEVLYILNVEDPTVKQKQSWFIIFKFTETPVYIDVVGFHTNNKNQIDALITISDAEKLAQDNNLQIVNKRFPWARIIDIENKTYRRKG